MAGEGKIIGQDIVDQSAHDAVILLTKESDELLKKFVELAGGITTFRTALGNVKGYDDVTKAIAGQKTQLTELDKIKNQIKATDEKVRASMTLEAQILARVRQELREVNKETADFIKSNKMQEGSLDQLRATLNRLNKEYSALGAAERDAAKGKDLINKLQETRDKVYSLETSMGNWTRNVGNYKSGFSAIGNSVAQISREMPAFANSLNTGFMAISNNLPALSDAIKGIREQNKLLAAEGKPTESVLKQLGSAVFSWNTLLSVGVTLLTVYGGKIWDYITGNENAAKSTKELKKTVDDLNDAYDVVNMAIESTDYKNAVQNIQTLKDEVQLAKEGFISKDGVVKHYNDTLGTTMGIVKNLNDVEQKLIDNGDAYIEMMLMKASANLALEKAGNLALEAEQKRREKHKVDINAYEDPSMGQGFFENFMTSMRGELPYETVMNKFDKDIQESTDSMDEWNDIAKQFLKNAGEISKKMNFNYFGDSKVTKPKKAKKEKTSKEKSDEVLSGINGLDREIQLMNEKTDQATIERVQKGAEEKKKLNAKYAKDELDLIIENIKAQEAMLSQADKDEEDRIRKKIEGLNQYAEYASNLMEMGEAIADIAYQREIARLDGREQKMNEYYDSEEKRINSSFTSQADKDRELTKIAVQREVEQKKIDQDRRIAERKRAQSQKSFDVASIISSTALAVIKAYTEGDPYTKIPRAVAAGAAGAIALAKAISAPIPAYAEGTENHPGGLAQVSERGSELIVEPSGKSYLSPDKTAILNLPAKTKVIPHEELLKRIHQVATIKLANSGQAVNESSMNIALQEAFNELTNKVDKLTTLIDRKQWGGDVYVDTTHISHVKSKVR
jgi:hypothetical protein